MKYIYINTEWFIYAKKQIFIFLSRSYSTDAFMFEFILHTLFPMGCPDIWRLTDCILSRVGLIFVLLLLSPVMLHCGFCRRLNWCPGLMYYQLISGWLSVYEGGFRFVFSWLTGRCIIRKPFSFLYWHSGCLLHIFMQAFSYPDFFHAEISFLFLCFSWRPSSLA